MQQITRSFGANSQSTQPRRRSKRTVISSNPSADILDDKITLTTLSKNSLIKQPSMSTIGASASSSTPNSINYTKRLAPEFDHSAGKITCLNSIERHSFHPHTTFAASSTSTPAGSALTEAPATRSDMPRLRSSSFRASNIVENHGTPLTSASQGARKHSSLVSQLGKQVYIPKDSASTPGPRTRSQVAKAAASSRRSSRLLGTHHASLTFVAQNVSNKGHELAKCNDLCVNDLALGHLSNSKNPNPCGLAKSSMLNTSSTALASQVGPTMCCSPVLTESLNGNIKLPPQQWDQVRDERNVGTVIILRSIVDLFRAYRCVYYPSTGVIHPTYLYMVHN
ncbi:unnamed protein product [Protopolystoma xenopodis]|uniref:Uncharacterized protein n=1 Tax=Protopolystoma xenopodis TaxID=117903 RepID=A0A3S5CIM9_9PLAT|nr:unnamed protein product [Protopolystoma xenopodis]